jgi:signal transduction histidine kinase
MANSVLDSSPIYEFIFRSSSNGVLVADSESVIRQINPAAAAMLGVSGEELIGKAIQDLFHKNPVLLNLFLRDNIHKQDVQLPHQRIALGIAETLNTGERIVLLQDITEQRNIENRREALSKVIAHDLRNPISAIGGFADLVGRFGDLNDNQQKYLQRIKQTTSKLNELVKSLVDLAWMEAGMPLEHVQIRLDETVQKVVNDVKGLAQKQNVHIAISVQKPLPVVIGDLPRLTMVIRNLLHNAITYSKPETTIAIHAWGNEHEVFCSVADRGIGIIDSELELIFDRMYRSRDERIREISGGGLGLTVAQTIIKRHGGKIWASSNLGEGSTFTFMLPAVEL